MPVPAYLVESEVPENCTIPDVVEEDDHLLLYQQLLDSGLGVAHAVQGPLHTLHTDHLSSDCTVGGLQRV